MKIEGNTLVKVKPQDIVDGTFTLPEEITHIGKWAFRKRTDLTHITLHAGLKSIGDAAFGSCSGLTHITLPKGLASIGISAFSRCCSLTQITLPEGITHIATHAFSYSGLTHITLHEGITHIGMFAFIECTNLTHMTLPEGLTSIGDYAFSDCTGLTHMTLPKGLTSIGFGAFYGCTGLTQITLPEGLASIGNRAFEGCTGLTRIFIDSSDPVKYEQIRRMIPREHQEKATKVTDFLNTTCSTQPGPDRDSAIRFYIEGKVPENKESNELYQRWLEFREAVLRASPEKRVMPSLVNLCLFAVNKTGDELRKSLPPGFFVSNQPETPEEILAEFNRWATENRIYAKEQSEAHQACSSTSSMQRLTR